jgi:thiol:disulfide interchange protein DsbD
MKSLKYLFIAIPLLFFFNRSTAQDDPTTWKYQVKKISATEYQLVFHLDITKGWHIWSMTPGGDGMEIAPSFTFDKNPAVKLKGKTVEKGNATTTKMEGIDGKITYLTGEITYTQDVEVRGNAKITGKHTYQVCNDRMCLRPMDRDFVFEVK